MILLEKSPGSFGGDDGHLVPRKPQKSAIFEAFFLPENGYLVPKRAADRLHTYLDGNFARRRLPSVAREYCVWDTYLTGFGLRIRPSGTRSWFVRLRQRGKQRRIGLGNVEDVEAHVARLEARRLLAQQALDGLPRRPTAKAAPTMTEYFDEFWRDCARNWKPGTQRRNQLAWSNNMFPVLGQARVDRVTRADVLRWRDGFAGRNEGAFNRAIPVLSAMMGYAELLGYRRKGTNPCRGMARYKRAAKERFLTPNEYRRLGVVLAEEEAARPLEVAIVRLLLLTGARYSEIATLRWDWIKPPRLDLPDSKTGPKIVWLNHQALEILNSLPRSIDTPQVFPLGGPVRGPRIDNWWYRVRRRCGIPDVRIHDLRHSFASSAIMANVPLATIGRILGHALPETTAKYAHLADEVIADAATRVSGGLARQLGLSA